MSLLMLHSCTTDARTHMCWGAASRSRASTVACSPKSASLATSCPLAPVAIFSVSRLCVYMWVEMHRCTANQLCTSVPCAAEFLTAALNVLGASVPSKLGEVRIGVDRVNLGSRTSKGLAPLTVLNPPSLSNTFSSLTSRWMMQGVCACRNASPSAI